MLNQCTLRLHVECGPLGYNGAAVPYHLMASWQPPLCDTKYYPPDCGDTSIRKHTLPVTCPYSYAGVGTSDSNKGLCDYSTYVSC